MPVSLFAKLANANGAFVVHLSGEEVKDTIADLELRSNVDALRLVVRKPYAKGSLARVRWFEQRFVLSALGQLADRRSAHGETTRGPGVKKVVDKAV